MECSNTEITQYKLLRCFSISIGIFLQDSPFNVWSAGEGIDVPLLIGKDVSYDVLMLHVLPLSP